MSAPNAHMLTKNAVNSDKKLASAIAIIHTGTEFARWQRAFRVLRKIRDEDKYAAAMDVLLSWAVADECEWMP